MAMNGLNKITDKILDAAKSEADRIIANADAECSRISEDYTMRADAIRESLIAEAEREGTDLISRAKAGAATKKRNKILEMQSRLLDEVFADALAQMRHTTGEGYLNLLNGLLCSALNEQLKSEEESRILYGEEEAMAPERYEVLLNARDREQYGAALIESARKSLSGKVHASVLQKLVLSERTVSIDGGLVLRCGDIESNCSLALLFAQLREEMEPEVSRALFGAENSN